MIKPTIGRKLWYWSSLSQYQQSLDYPEHCNCPIDLQPQDATIVGVWSPTMLNLHVIDHSGNARAETSVPLMQEGDQFPQHGGFATWMPFQVGQARAQGQAKA